MNKFEQVSSDGHQMSRRGCPHVPCVEGVELGGALYIEVQCIMGNGHLGTPPPEQNDRHL